MTGFGHLLRDLNGESVRYVVVGGIAVIRHGVVRATKDLDVVVALDEDTATAVRRLIVRWQATRRPEMTNPGHFPPLAGRSTSVRHTV